MLIFFYLCTLCIPPMDYLSQIDKQRIPKHIAIIMDGNGRWAQQQGAERIFGHHNGVSSVKDTVEAAAEIGVKFLTLYAFSTENWNRPKAEVEALMELLVNTIHRETPTLNKNGIRLTAIGDLGSLPANCRAELQEAMLATAGNTTMTLILALSYSSKWEIVSAVREIAKKVKEGKINPEEISEETISGHLCTANFPDPELMIRTSGEQRISNFLLWQLAYAEFYFCEVLWPEFRKENLYEAILDYQKRERRFGKTSDQIISETKSAS